MSHIRVDLPNMNNKWAGFGLTNVDTFIIRVGFRLTNINTIRILTRHEYDSLTRIVTPRFRVTKWPKLHQTPESSRKDL